MTQRAIATSVTVTLVTTAWYGARKAAGLNTDVAMADAMGVHRNTVRNAQTSAVVPSLEFAVRALHALRGVTRGGDPITFADLFQYEVTAA